MDLGLNIPLGWNSRMILPVSVSIQSASCVSLFYFRRVGVLPACMPPHPVRAWCPQRPEEDVSAPGTAVVDGCEFHVGAESQTSVLWKSSGL